MSRLKKLFAALFVTIANSGCATFKVSDIGPMVQLPVSKQCFQVYTLSGREVIYPPEQCKKIQQRALLLTPETWAVLRADIQRNCQYAQCKQITGAVDDMFMNLDRALKLIP